MSEAFEARSKTGQRKTALATVAAILVMLMGAGCMADVIANEIQRRKA